MQSLPVLGQILRISLTALRILLSSYVDFRSSGRGTVGSCSHIYLMTELLTQREKGLVQAACREVRVHAESKEQTRDEKCQAGQPLGKAIVIPALILNAKNSVDPCQSWTTLLRSCQHIRVPSSPRTGPSLFGSFPSSSTPLVR